MTTNLFIIDGLENYKISMEKLITLTITDQINTHLDSIISGKCLALVDQEIRGSSQSGLSVIREKNILNESVLVTNNYAVKELCLNVKRVGVKIIPRPVIEEIEVL